MSGTQLVYGDGWEDIKVIWYFETRIDDTDIIFISNLKYIPG